MRILACSHIFPPAIDGGSQIVYNFCHTMEQKGHNVLYLSSDANSTDDFVSKYVPQKNIKSRFLRLPVYPKLHRIFHIPIGPIFKLLPTIKCLFSIYKYKPDLIVSGPLPTTIVLYTRLFQIITKAKVLFIPCFHSTDSSFYFQPYLKYLKHFYLWTFSNYEKETLVSYCPKIFTSYPGINQKFFKRNIVSKKSFDKINILFLGNFATHKGIVPLISSLQYLDSKYILTLAGQKTLYYSTILQHIKNLSPSVQSRVKLIAKKYNISKEKQLLAKADLLVLPSTQESFGLVLAESMSQKVPVLVYNLPSTKQFISDSKGGYLLVSLDPKVISQTISTIFSNITNYNSYAKNGYSFVKTKLNWDTITTDLCEFIFS